MPEGDSIYRAAQALHRALAGDFLGHADPRVASALANMAEQHDISVSAIKDGGFDIASVDGRPVGPSNVAARDLAEALGTLPPSLRPSEVGSPWLISSPGYFSDAEHQKRNDHEIARFRRHGTPLKVLYGPYLIIVQEHTPCPRPLGRRTTA